MEADFKALEDKVQELVGHCRHLRDVNQHLRQELAQAINENKQLTEKIGSARSRLEALLTRIPESEA